MAEKVGYRVVGTITVVKGQCHWGHKVGDKIELGIHDVPNDLGIRSIDHELDALAQEIVIELVEVVLEGEQPLPPRLLREGSF